MIPDDISELTLDELRTFFSKGTAMMMQLQILVGIPNHQLEVGFMENLEEAIDPKILQESGKIDWLELAKEKGQGDEKYEEALLYYT